MINVYHQFEPDQSNSGDRPSVNPFGLFLPQTEADQAHQSANGRYLLWIDLEATSLNTDTAACLEVAAKLTSLDTTVLYGQGFSAVRQEPEVYEQADDWVKNNIPEVLAYSRHASSDAVMIDRFLCRWLDVVAQAYSMTEPIIHLAGNSVWYDRAIIRRQFPKLNARLHYRQLDVSSIQIFMDAAFPKNPDPRRNMKKMKKHRALADINESIEQYARFLDFSQNPSKML